MKDEGKGSASRESLFDTVSGTRPIARKRSSSKILNYLKKRDRRLGAVIERVGPFRLKPKYQGEPFEALTEAIVYQQLTGKAAATIYKRLKDNYGDRCPEPSELLETSDTVLRQCGLSRPKMRAMRDLATKTLDGTLPALDSLQDMEDSTVIEQLTRVKGVGTWTAQMFLIFGLGRPDVMPSTDYGVRKGFTLVFTSSGKLAEPPEIDMYAELWRPYRSVASWYMWRVLEL